MARRHDSDRHQHCGHALEYHEHATHGVEARNRQRARNTAQSGDPAEIRYPTINSVIAENVIDLGVRLYVRDATTSTGLRLVFPASNTTLTYAAKTPSNTPDATDPFPDMIDVMV